MSKKYYLFVLGCQMNKSDAERARSVLESLNFIETKEEKAADLIGVVACSVRQTAIDRIWGKARFWQKIKKSNHNFKTFLTGCVLKNDQQKMSSVFDIIFEISDLEKLRQFVADNFLGNNLIFNLNNERDYFQIQPKYTDKFRAFVPIMTGCNNFCSYCAVPYARGRERSRKMADVLAEIKKLEAKGCLEIILLGQNVNSYNPEDKDDVSVDNPYKHPFARLLWAAAGEGIIRNKGISGIKVCPSKFSEGERRRGIKRIFFTASHPKDMDDGAVAN